MECRDKITQWVLKDLSCQKISYSSVLYYSHCIINNCKAIDHQRPSLRRESVIVPDNNAGVHKTAKLPTCVAQKNFTELDYQRNALTSVHNSANEDQLKEAFDANSEGQ